MTRRHVLRLLAAVLTVAGWAAPALAQGDTTVRFYIVPKVGTGTGQDPFRAKYLADSPSDFPASGTGAIAGLVSCMDYGLEPVFFCGAAATVAEDASISAQPDVIAIPNGSLDTQLTSINLATVKTQLENLKIPAGWITTSHTVRDYVRFITQLFRVFQRYHAVANASLFVGGITLDSTVSQLTAGQRNNLQQVAIDLGLDFSSITGATTIRAALRILGPQLPPVSILAVGL